ncbi:hypothetical protein [Candidatus Accumulibacter contiguus]|nr:hypothetical protein [Candidatus Accumulibacter contiguus]
MKAAASLADRSFVAMLLATSPALYPPHPIGQDHQPLIGIGKH